MSDDRSNIIGFRDGSPIRRHPGDEETVPLHRRTVSEDEVRRVMDAAAPLLITEGHIRSLGYRATAIMLPSDLLAHPGESTLYGVPVIWGDRAALIYEAPRQRTETD